MTQRTKLLLAGGAALALFLFLRRKEPKANILITEASLQDGCKCFVTDAFSDGTQRKRQVSMEECLKDPDLEEAALRCLANSPQIPFLESLGAKVEGAVAALFNTPSETARNPGQAV